MQSSISSRSPRRNTPLRARSRFLSDTSQKKKVDCRAAAACVSYVRRGSIADLSLVAAAPSRRLQHHSLFLARLCVCATLTCQLQSRACASFKHLRDIVILLLAVSPFSILLCLPRFSSFSLSSHLVRPAEKQVIWLSDLESSRFIR